MISGRCNVLELASTSYRLPSQRCSARKLEVYEQQLSSVQKDVSDEEESDGSMGIAVPKRTIIDWKGDYQCVNEDSQDQLMMLTEVEQHFIIQQQPQQRNGPVPYDQFMVWQREKDVKTKEDRRKKEKLKQEAACTEARRKMIMWRIGKQQRMREKQDAKNENVEMYAVWSVEDDDEREKDAAG